MKNFRRIFSIQNIVLILCSVIGILVISCGHKKGQSLSGSEDIKVISFNIRNSASAIEDGENRWENRHDAVAMMIATEKPSVFGLQEALPDQIQFFKDSFPQYTMVGVGRDDGIDKGEYMAIYYLNSTYDLINSGTFWLSETPDSVSKGWDACCFRTTTWVELRDKSSKEEFYYFNTHFDHVGEVAREESVKLIVSKIKEIVPEGKPVVFGGDLNSDISSDIFLPLKGFMTLASECSPLSDVMGTYNGYGTIDEYSVIDYIFCKNVKCKSYKTLTDNYGVPFISDHYPVAFEFEVD